MSYLVLARKYRPRSFDEVIGQEVVTRLLRGALAEGRIGHAYLFSGPRGTGKTTLARILAKCLNCAEGPTPDPCGACDRCQAAEKGTEVDIIELDAASHTGVDTIRELRDEATYAPMRARHKVYIIDEVHMLSKGAFNALLKTLEEPPPHVVFLFATTEPHKVLDTILSRCQVLRLEPLPEEKISARLAEVFRQEGVEPGEGVVEELARSARGGMRDALSSADKLLALAGNEPTLQDLERLAGDGGVRGLDALLSAVEAGETATMLEGLADLGGSEAEVVSGLLERVRHGTVLLHCGEKTPLVPGSPEEKRVALEFAKRLGAERIELWLQELLRSRERMRLFPGQERVVLEVTLLDLCREPTTLLLGELTRRLEELEGRLGPGAAQEAAPVAPAGSRRSSPAPEPTPEPRAAARSEPARPAPSSDLPAGPELWQKLLAQLEGTHGSLAECLRNRGQLDGDVLAVRPVEEKEHKLLADRRNQAAIRRAFSQLVGRELEVRLEGSVPPPEKGEAPPARKSAPRADGFTQEVADLFGGVVEEPQ